jgi:hypothetical protein
MTPAEFHERTRGIVTEERGIFPSELYLFASACLDAGVVSIVESGVCHGVSTRVLHALFPRHVSSVEKDKRVLPRRFPFKVVIGNGRVLVPQLVARVERAGLGPIGILLDGPKSERARAIKDRCVHEYPAVRVVGIHDHHPGLGFGETRHSWDVAFRTPEVCALDEDVPAVYHAAHPRGPGLALWTR